MNEPTTFLDALIESIRQAGIYNKNDQVPPAAVLWTDKERQWEPLLPLLLQHLPLLALGPYTPAQRIGPVYWLRCMIAHRLPEDILPEDAVPIIYLPGVSRQEIRAIEECPKTLQPLAELQYRGVLWTHRNGRDWTVISYLQTNTNDGGLGIEVGADRATKEALQRALQKIIHEPLARLRREAPLRASFFDSLLNPDEIRQLLLWMNNYKDFPNQLTPEEWNSLCEICKKKYGFHPEKDGPITAGQKLGQREANWELVWQRFSEAPDDYPNIPYLLRQACPQQQLGLLETSASWPQHNEAAELNLRQKLTLLREALTDEVRKTVFDLEKEHGVRRTWVWAKLGWSPLTFALEHLVALAQATEKAIDGSTMADIAQTYTQEGWKADAAVIDTLASVEKAEDLSAVKAAILPLYRPWLERAANAMQKIIAEHPTKNYVTEKPIQAEDGTCLLFSDALRFDVSQRLVVTLEKSGLSCESQWRLAALPPVTPTAKPAIAPVTDEISGGSSKDLVPVVAKSGVSININTLRKLLELKGYQILMGDELGDPSGKAWIEIGEIDQYGHQNGWKVAHHLVAELRKLKDCIETLLDHGWNKVVVITDHGWLMLPEDLPKAELKQHLTETRKGRCAVLKEGAQTEHQIVPWHWNNEVLIVVAPGIMCFEAGKEYEHGGLSPQECIVPVISILRNATSTRIVAIKEVNWKGLRCTIRLDGDISGMTVDIRSKAGDPTTSLVDIAKEPAPDGLVSLPVPDDDRIGDAAFIVVTTNNGIICAQTHTTVGG